MKKILFSLVLASSSFGLLAAQPTLNLASHQQLDALAVKQLVLKDGESAKNFWFEVSPNQLEGTSQAKISSCAFSSNLNLANGELQVTTKQMRCINEEGDIFTKANFVAHLTTPLEQLCADDAATCAEVVINKKANYPFVVAAATRLEAELNLMREVNRARLVSDSEVIE